MRAEAPSWLPRCAQVFLTTTHLAIAMEYAQGGDLFNYTLGHRPHGRLAEQQGRWIFQQLIIGLDYCHRRVREKGCLNRLRLCGCFHGCCWCLLPQAGIHLLTGLAY